MDSRIIESTHSSEPFSLTLVDDSDDDNNDDDNNDKPKRKRWPTLSLLPRLPVMPGKLNGKVFFNGAMMVRLDE